MASPTIVIRSIIGGLVLAGTAVAFSFILPMATDDERSILTKMARSAPATTCLALKSVERSGYLQNWSSSMSDPRGPEIERAQPQARSRDVALALDAETIVDNLLKFDCRDRATISTPSFSGNLAFAEMTDRRERKTIVFEKIGGRWAVVGQDIQPLNIVVI